MNIRLPHIIVLLIIICNTSAYGQHYTRKDSITIFTDSVFNIVQEKNLYREKIDWLTYRKKFLAKALTSESFEASLPLFNTIWKELGDNHTGFSYKGNTITNAKSYTGQEFSPALLERYQQGNFEFECKVLNNQYGYIFMPPINLPSGKNMESMAQSMYNTILKTAHENEIKGWIIDLRLNIGGNSWPMIASLYELLGDGPVVGWQIEGKIKKMVLDNGTITDKEDYLIVDRTNKKDLSKIKVALITSVITGSSGEIVAIAFKGRENTIFIGEPTAGYTTTNNTYEMPFGVYFNNSEGYDVDRNGNIYPVVTPDIHIKKSDNFKKPNAGQKCNGSY